MVSSIRDRSALIGVSLDEERWTVLAHYRDLILEWNQKFNLTAIREPGGVEERLFLDALRLIPTLDATLAGRGPGAGAEARLLDIGTGAGLPGMVIAIARPELAVTLLDATGKKVRFLEHVVVRLGLGRVRAVHGRAEDLGHDPDERGTYDVVTARAVSSLPALLELAAPFLVMGGTAMFPKTLDLDDELAAGRRAAPLVGMRVTAAEPLADSATRLVVATKRAQTPATYPRRSGLPAHDPLGGDGRGGVVPANRGGSRGRTP